MKSQNYQNPLWHGYFADPFILQHDSAYYAYGTGDRPIEPDGRACPILRSRDLMHWEYVGGAIAPVRDCSAYWAPEVVAINNQFYLYYSAAIGSGDAGHRIRVAVADSPLGPFVDSGHVVLPDEGFTIDAHPFQDPQSGQWYMFFASDYTNDEPYGTGVGVVELKDMFHASGQPRMVNRATQDWQVYERDRNYKEKIWNAWYTVEGPTVTYHAGKYWCFYSGGRWSGDGYGVGFAVANHPLGPWRDDFAVHGPVVLRGVPNQVIGPGHNSLLALPRGQVMIVYHAWDAARAMRRMCMDRLIWTPDGPRCDGPTLSPQTF